MHGPIEDGIKTEELGILQKNLQLPSESALHDLKNVTMNYFNYCMFYDTRNEYE